MNNKLKLYQLTTTIKCINHQQRDPSSITKSLLHEIKRNTRQLQRDSRTRLRAKSVSSEALKSSYRYLILYPNKSNNKFSVFINPEVVEVSLSFYRSNRWDYISMRYNRKIKVKLHHWVKIKYYSMKLRKEIINELYGGEISDLIQIEIHHLNGGHDLLEESV